MSFGLASKCLVEFASSIGDITRQGSQWERFYLDIITVMIGLMGVCLVSLVLSGLTALNGVCLVSLV